MASSNDTSNGQPAQDADLAQIAEAWTHIAKGEKTAQALEANLTSLEKKIDDLLACFEESERLKVEELNSKRIGQGEGKDSGDGAKD